MKNKILIFIAIVFSIMSCEKDLLDITPQDKFSAVDVFNDENLIRLFINGCYSKIYLHGLYRYNQIGHATDELHSIKEGKVMYSLIQEGKLTQDNIDQIHPFLHNWEESYKVLQDIIYFQSQIGESEIDTDLKNQMIGEMRFMRAFIYANLIWRYGGVPIVHKFDLNASDFSIARSTYDACVDTIVKEINLAIQLLPDKYELEDENRGLATADAARALKSRVLLYAASPLNNTSNDMAKWQAASDAAKEIIDSAHYALNDDYQQLFLADNDEIIFARYHTNASEMELSLQVGRNYDHGWGSDSPTQNLVDNYEMTNGEKPYLADGSINPASGYDDQNPYVDRDPRFYASILYDGSMWMDRETETFISGGSSAPNGKDSRKGPNEDWNGTMSGYYLKKFVPEDVSPSSTTDYATSPYIFFRYGEILLNYAEAQYNLGHEDIARDYLNIVRSRVSVDMPDVDDTGDDLLKRIQNERRIELVFEGHRYFDVRRWKIADETENEDIRAIVIKLRDDDSKTYDYTSRSTILITRYWYDRLYLLPIPRAEVERSLGTVEQNPGYDDI